MPLADFTENTKSYVSFICVNTYSTDLIKMESILRTWGCQPAARWPPTTSGRTRRTRRDDWSGFSCSPIRTSRTRWYCTTSRCRWSTRTRRTQATRISKFGFQKGRWRSRSPHRSSSCLIYFWLFPRYYYVLKRQIPDSFFFALAFSIKLAANKCSI